MPCAQARRIVEALVAEKEDKDETKVAELVASGVKPVRLVYADGGQNPVFTGYKDVSDPEALASGPQEIVLERPAKPFRRRSRSPWPTRTRSAIASVASAPVDAPAAQPAPTTVVAPAAPAKPVQRGCWAG